MIIQHNLSSMNAYRMLGITTLDQSKKTEKLSSGYRINRAADDAAGLAISEKMRRQIRGLTQASFNAQDGISLVQVADGALSEMHDIFQRMNVLSVQSANGTNTDTDRSYLQNEVSQLSDEINRISKSTTFNEIYLFNREPLVKIDSDDYGNAGFDDKALIGDKNYTHTKEMDFSKITSENINQLIDKKFTVKCSQGCGQIFEFKFTKGTGITTNITTTEAGTSRPSLHAEIGIENITNGSELTERIFEAAKEINDFLDDSSHGATTPSGSLPSPGSADSYRIGHANAVSRDGDKLTFFATDNSSNGKIIASDLDTNAETIFLQVGSEKGQVIGVNLYTINSSTLGISGIDISTVRGANEAIDKVKGGILKLSEYRSYYGAIQNRLEHTINNLNNIVENTTSAESEIRDTDMAEDMVKYSLNNILLQSGQAMLTQASQKNQGVLSLIQ